MAEDLISVIVPVFNEEGNINTLYDRIKIVFEPIPENFELIFVDDGSIDNSGMIIRELARADHKVRLLTFTRNFGHQQAVSAGLKWCQGNCAIIIDADLQDPPELIPDMLTKWREGYQVVYATRSKRMGLICSVSLGRARRRARRY